MNGKNLFIILATLTVIISCQGGLPRAEGWSLHMRGMAESYEKLVPYMFNSKRYSDPNNEKFISTYLKRLNQNVSDLDRHTARGLSGNDPLFNIGLKGLKSVIQKATESYYVESYDYSQRLLQTSMNYCNSCHSRTNLGPTFIQWDQFEASSAQLLPLDHAHLLVATRQFPRAIEVIESGLLNNKIAPKKQEQSIYQLLTLELKNLNSPQRALTSLEKLQKIKIPTSVAKSIPKWKTYLNKLASGQLKSKNNIHTLLKSRKADGSFFVESLHNSLILHKALSTELDKNYRAQIYFALGKIYQKYPDLGLWNLPENYFEACIYENPGSKQALKCYFSLESLLEIYPSSKQNAFYEAEKDKLKKLKILATKNDGPLSPSSGGAGAGDL